jgi:hypothetical protein
LAAPQTSGSIALAPDTVGNTGFCVAPFQYLGFGTTAPEVTSPRLHIVSCTYADQLSPAFDLTGTWTDLGGNIIQVTHSGNTITCHMGQPPVISTGTVTGNSVSIQVVQTQAGFAPVGTTYNGAVDVQRTGGADTINWANAGAWVRQ